MLRSKLFRRILASIGILILAVVIVAGALWLYFHPDHARTDAVQYGTRNGQPLTMDILRPARPNGLAVAFMVSGGWKSQRAGEPPAWLFAPLLRRGYTVFAICHLSQPKASVQEIFDDMQRGIRFIRHNAREYAIDPQRIGVSGGSAGGHLSLLLATRGGPGNAASPDPIERESSAVQAVAIFYPVTDLVDLGNSTENLHDGGPPKSFTQAFGPTVTNKVSWTNIARDLSPLYHISKSQPPILIYHGTADTLTPPEQTQRFEDRTREAGATIEVVWHKDGAHGWVSMIWDVRRFADWFDRHLRPATP